MLTSWLDRVQNFLTFSIKSAASRHPGKRPIKDVNKHLRPISPTSILSKIAEDRVLEEYVNLLRVAENRRPAIWNWYTGTDGNEATTRVVLFGDFHKAFDLIDHNILARKLSVYDLPKRIKSWIVDFLIDRKQ